MHDLRKVFCCAAKVKLKIGFHLIEEFTPGTGVKRRTLCQRGLNRFGQEVALEYANMLDPGAMPGNKRLGFIPVLEDVITELDKLQLKKGQMFPSQSAQFPMKGGVL